MSDIAAFLSARLDEDEALARQAAQVAGPDWTWKTEVPEGWDAPTDYVISPAGALLLDTMGGIEGEAPHVARHDPARVLREVEAKRNILARYEDCLTRQEDQDYPYAPAAEQAREYEDFVLPNLVAAWSDHPDYDQDWTP